MSARWARTRSPLRGSAKDTKKSLTHNLSGWQGAATVGLWGLSALMFCAAPCGLQGSGGCDIFSDIRNR